MHRRTFLYGLPAVSAALALWPSRAPAQDVEFIRAWERTQRERPARVPSRARIAPAGEPGTPLAIHGQVFRTDGKTPAPNITLFAYHTDRTGLYDDRSKPPHSWRLRGWATTDATGRFDFDTIRPAPYPGRGIPAHIHLSLEGPGVARRWLPEVRFADDALVTATERAASASEGLFGGVRAVRMHNGAQVVDVHIKITATGLF